jgi:glycogen debranching enzyme
MTPDGFNVDIVTDWTKGFILGGNEHNCGTWMDKMGVGGVPATPRDGAAIEIVGILQSTLRWLASCHEAGLYPFGGVSESLSWSHWSDLLCANFESWFYIPGKADLDEKYFIESKFVGIRGIYKDIVGSSCEFADYQFRPNVAVAMTVAPELFDPVHAVRCLDRMEERLMGAVGMRTLDASDWQYRPFWHSREPAGDVLTEAGFNYHNGPEWVWPVGYFFRASMRFRRGITVGMKKMLARIKKWLGASRGVGLPELTQKDGEVCGDGCVSQAWSVAAILDIMYDYSLLTEEDVLEWAVDDEEELE